MFAVDNVQSLEIKSEGLGVCSDFSLNIVMVLFEGPAPNKPGLQPILAQHASCAERPTDLTSSLIELSLSSVVYPGR